MNIPDQIVVRGARLHNLKNITVTIPKNRLVVLTGLSGSGKSTLGFDILLKEGQRQYMESLGFIASGMAKLPVESITGLTPSISVDQHLTNRNPRSTVGTQTDVFTYLRVLFARLGHRPCPRCGKVVPPLIDPAELNGEPETSMIDEEAASEATFPCQNCGAPLPEYTMAYFSFNKPEGACPTCTGLGIVHQANLPRLLDEEKTIAEGAVQGWDEWRIQYYSPILMAAASHYGFSLDLSKPIKEFSQEARELLLFGVESPRFSRYVAGIEPPATVSKGRFEGAATNLLRRYAEHTLDEDYLEKMGDLVVTQTCPDCSGTRLKTESRAVTVGGNNIIEVSSLPLTELGDWLESLPSGFSREENILSGPILEELKDYIDRLVEVGAGYLSIDRTSPTLSAGEAQRLRLASLLGSGLSGVLYVFDEPTIGLHQRDTRRMVGVLKKLRDLGNTVLVIEHDLETIAAADHVVDFGPGAGKHGGQVVAAGSPAELIQQSASLTGDYLAGRRSITVPEMRHSPNGKAITVHGAREHNLKNLTVRFPLGLMIAVTGVSGSGKSSLVFDILGRAVRARLNRSTDQPGEHDFIEGTEHLDRIITIDQEPIGRTPRSNAATYTDTFTAIREAFAAVPEARQKGIKASHFSFNVPGGRCERCEGAGALTVKMQLLPDVDVRCPVCHGKRFKRETLAVRYQGFDISQVLEMTVEEALALFEDEPQIRWRLQVLNDVGLGYLQLGQPATTLSGGEAQRIKLSKELGRKLTGRTLYMLDEPTTGLHLEDTRRLLGVLQRLVEAGNTVVVVEHNLELVKVADWVIDLGPEGGAGGGRLIAEGTPEEVAEVEESVTGVLLRDLLRKP